MSTPSEPSTGPAGQLIGPRGTREASVDPLSLLRTLMLARSPTEPEGRDPALLLAEADGSDEHAADAVRAAIARLDRGAAEAGGVLDKYLDRSQLSSLPLDVRGAAFARRARLRHEQANLSGAAEDWLAVSCSNRELLPAAVFSWVALDRLRAGDASALAIRFYRDHVQELDRVIKDRPLFDREGLYRMLEGVCAKDWGAPDAQVVDLVRRLLRLNNRRAGLLLVLGVRLLHLGQVQEASAALDQAEEAAQRAPFQDRRESLFLLWLYRGAVALQDADVHRARCSFRKATGLCPTRLEAPLMYAELEASLGQAGQRLTQRRALRLVDKVEGLTAGPDTSLPAWLAALVGERCQLLRRKLSARSAS